MYVEYSAEDIQWLPVCISLKRDRRTETCAGAAELRVFKIEMKVDSQKM